MYLSSAVCSSSGKFDRRVSSKRLSISSLNSQMRVPLGINWSANNPIPCTALSASFVFTSSIGIYPSRFWRRNSILGGRPCFGNVRSKWRHYRALAVEHQETKAAPEREFEHGNR